MSYDIDKIRADFPLLSKKINDQDFVYLDNAATTQKPSAVIDSIIDSYTSCNANVHRGVYKMSREATAKHEAAREYIAQFIGAKKEELIFTRGTTESINAIAYTYGETNIHKGDHIVVTLLEHHSNFVPWQQLAKRKNASLGVVPFKEDGSLDMEAFYQEISKQNTKLVAFCQVSNVLGTVNPIQEMIAAVHKVGAIAVIDGAQAVAHTPVNVKDLDADFYAFSSHKMYGPTGIGALYGKASLLQAMPPFHFGGEMIAKVTVAETTFNELPYKFEAGTPDFIGSIAFAKAAEYILSVGFDNIRKHEQALLSYATKRLKEIDEINIIGTAIDKDPVLSFTVSNIHPYDLSLFLDQLGIAVRTGHHCAEPLMEALSLSSTVRASFALYNTNKEIDTLVESLKKSIALLS